MAPPDEMWFVQLKNVGTVLGPMPLDAVIEMARTGVLLRRDSVRRNESEHWRSASELPELMGEFAASVPSEENAEAAAVTEGRVATMPQPISSPQSAASANVDVSDDPLAFAFSGPSADVIVFPTELPRAIEPASALPNDFGFATAKELAVADRSVAVSSATARPQDAPSPSVSFEPTFSGTNPVATNPSANDASADDPVGANLASWSAPAPVAPPAYPRTFPSKAHRGSSTFARFGEAASELLTKLRQPVPLAVIGVLALLGLLGWYFFPSGQPVRRPPPQTAEVAGIIRLNGQPLPNALVMFRPDRSQGTIGPPSVGQSDASGQFQLTINNVHPGAVVGKHQVAVRSRDSTGSSSSSATVPKRYAQFETSPLITEVLPNQVNEITLDLKSN